MNTISQATKQRIIRSCHDCSEGGLAIAASEMAFAGGYGMMLNLSAVVTEGSIHRNDTILFLSQIPVLSLRYSLSIRNSLKYY